VVSMTVGDWGGLATGVASVYLLWQQNQIFRKQNDIFAAQSGGSAVPSLRAAFPLKRYWPMIIIAALTVANAMVIVYGAYGRHHPDTVLPTGDIQMFDAGPCRGAKAEADPNRGLFRNLNNVVKECERLPTGRFGNAADLVGNGYAEFSVSGVTPPDYTGNTTRISIRWFAEYSQVDPVGKLVDWNISVGCANEDLGPAFQVNAAVFMGAHLTNSTELELGKACKANEEYEIMIGRNAVASVDTLQNTVKVFEVEVDFR
jgi:hypothetical protein